MAPVVAEVEGVDELIAGVDLIGDIDLLVIKPDVVSSIGIGKPDLASIIEPEN